MNAVRQSREEWAYLAPGVRWLIKPADDKLVGQVTLRVAAMAAAAALGDYAEFFALGFGESDLPTFRRAILAVDARIIAGLSAYAAAVWYAEATLTGWEGVYDASGSPAAVTPGGIRQALQMAWNDRNNILLAAFLAWVRPPNQPIAADVVRLKAVARRHLEALGAGDPRFAPSHAEAAALQSLAAQFALDVALGPAAWHRPGAGGPLIGIDYDRCVNSNPDICNIDGGGFVRCLRAIEEVALEALPRH